MKWKKLNYTFHRDIGYLCIGMTLIYGISGIAVNHISNSFNPSYNISRAEQTISTLVRQEQPDQAYIQMVLQAIDEKGLFKNAALTSPENIRIFVEGSTIDVNLPTGRVTTEKVERKPLLYEVNFLHLNKAKGVWTWLADIYALGLIVLAITGLCMIGGKRKHRALLLVLTGILIPFVYLLVNS